MKVLWAVDALDPFPEGMKKIAEVLGIFSKTVKLDIHPVFMLSPEQLGLASDFSEPSLPSYLETNAGKALDLCMKDVRVPGLQKPETLVHHRHSLRGSVKKLAEYAVVQDFDLVVTGSHGRRGLQRLVVGSFTEELLLQSKTPVLVVGSHMEIGANSENRILIPNDLGDLSSPFFKETFRLVKRLGAKATFLHAIPRPMEAFLETGIYLLSGGWVPIPMYLRDEKSKQELKVEELNSSARSEGIVSDSIIDHECTGVAESILGHAKEKRATLITMAAQSGPVATALLGSIARKVIRDAPCPVWITRQ